MTQLNDLKILSSGLISNICTFHLRVKGKWGEEWGHKSLRIVLDLEKVLSQGKMVINNRSLNNKAFHYLTYLSMEQGSFYNCFGVASGIHILFYFFLPFTLPSTQRFSHSNLLPHDHKWLPSPRVLHPNITESKTGRKQALPFYISLCNRAGTLLLEIAFT